MGLKRFVLFSLFPLAASSQTPASTSASQRARSARESIYPFPLTRAELNRALNAEFSKLVAGNPNPGEISNYATLDPVNASFNIKGTIPVRRKGRKQDTTETDLHFVENPDSARISYLSFSVAGALIDKQYGVLFSDSKANTGIAISVQYNFGMKANHFGFYQAEWEDIAEKRRALSRKYTNDLAAIQDKTNYEAYRRSVYLLNLQQLSTRDKLAKKNLLHDLAQKSVDSLGANITDRTGLADTLRTLEKEAADLVMEIRTTQQTIDSVNRLVATQIDAQRGLLNKTLLEKFQNDHDSLLLSVPFKKFTTTWYTVFAEYNRKSYNTFDISLPFASQIKESEKADAYKIGLAINYLKQDKLKHWSFFLNGGISWIYKSNLDQLTAITVDQRKQYSNTAGDTARSITTKYSVYTDPVTTSGGLNISGHAYYIFGKKPSGLHVFPSLDIQGRHSVFNCTLGYIIAFKNTVKDQPVINTELYIRFNDITNDADIESKFYKRNEIGLSFTIPFNIF